MIERPPSDAPRGLCPVRGGCSARGCAAMRAVAVLRTAMRSAALDRTVGRVRGGLSGVRWLQCARLRCDARGCSAAHRDALSCAGPNRRTRPRGFVRCAVVAVRAVALRCARLQWAALRAALDRTVGRSRAGCVQSELVAVRAVALRCARLRTAMRAELRPAVLQLRWVSATDRGQMRRNIKARFTSWIALVTWMPRGQASVQLKVVRQRQTPSESERISSRSCAA